MPQPEERAFSVDSTVQQLHEVGFPAKLVTAATKGGATHLAEVTVEIVRAASEGRELVRCQKALQTLVFGAPICSHIPRRESAARTPLDDVERCFDALHHHAHCMLPVP